MILATILILTPFVLILIKWLQEKNRYWEKRNVKYLPPKLFFGNTYESLIGSKNICEVMEQVYLKFPDEDVVGFYQFLRPQLIIRNPKLIEKILIKDFSYFMDRSLITPTKIPLAVNLFNMCGKQWRLFRYKLAPIFTSGKLKTMFGPLSDCGQNLTTMVDSTINKEVDMKEVMTLFATDVIGSCAFGINPGVMHNPSCQFRINAKKIFEDNLEQYFRIIINFIAPEFAMKLGITFFNPKIMKYFCDIIFNTLQFRTEHRIERNDFVQMLLLLKTSGNIDMPLEESKENYMGINDHAESNEIKVNDELLMGTAFGFLSAGFHTTASTLTYALYELALQPHILLKVRKEVKDQIAVHGEITYDALRCMIYLEKVIKETMRLHPAAVFLIRTCTKAYTLPSGLKLSTGDSVIIPVYALHRDPHHHADAHIFNPNRFDTPPSPCTYLPFGEGPRICIGMKFAMLEIKYALAKLLVSYDIKLSKRNKTPLQMSPRGFLNTPLNKVYFIMSKI